MNEPAISPGDVLLESLYSHMESIGSIELAVTERHGASMVSATRFLQASVLTKFAAFLAENAEFLPSKETVLGLLSKAIDLAFDTLNRPVIANLLKPLVKQQILVAAGAMYDSIFTSTRTEV